MRQLAISPPVRAHLPRFIGIFFGFLWGVVAALALPPPDQSPALAFAALVSLGCLLRVRTSTPSAAPDSALFRRRAYIIAVAFEIAAISLANYTLARLGWQQYLYSAVGFIVGLHFIGLWKASGRRSFLTVSGSMCLVSALSLLVPFTWKMCHLRYTVLGAANAAILWRGATEGR